MDGYQLIASLVQSVVSLAWPAAFVIGICMFRHKLNELLPLLRFKYKDVETSFRLGKAEEEQSKLPPPETPAPPPTPEEVDRFEDLAKHSPKAAVLELRSDVEEAVRCFAEAMGVQSGRVTRDGNAPLGLLIRELRKHDLIDSHTSAILDDLRAIGNGAAHRSDQVLTLQDARRYRHLADNIIQQLAIATAAAKVRGIYDPSGGTVLTR
jgi:hypothetical protein